jgi:hypothetical protein
MAMYALMIVPHDWDTDQAPGLSEAGYEQWKHEIEAGIRVVLFKDAPVSAVVAEGELSGIALKLAELPSQNIHHTPMTRFGKQADYVLPIRILYQRDETTQIPLATVRQYLDDALFPQPSEEWRLLDDQTYQAVIQGWPGTAPA